MNILVVLVVCFGVSQAATNSVYDLRCGSGSCLLASRKDGEEGQVKVSRTVCVDDGCSSSLVMSDSKHLFECQFDFGVSKGVNNINRPHGQCEKLSDTPVGEALVRLALNEIADEFSASLAAGGDESDEEEKDGDKRRQLPFETLNYGKRSSGSQRCECATSDNSGSNSYSKRHEHKHKHKLPFDSVLIGKRSLPFETLNYGKRNDYIPVDAYFLGKRGDD